MTLSPRPPAGFTLVELVVVVACLGVLGSTVAVMLPPVVKAHDAQARRTRLASDMGSATRLMTLELRSAVAGSVRSASTQCIEFVPTSAGGRLRRFQDTTRAGSAWLDSAGSTSVDVLSPLASVPVAGDWLVVNNSMPGAIYSGTSRTAISAVSTPSALLGTAKLTFPSFAVSDSYTSGRFAVVSASTQAVTYFCDGVGGAIDARGNAPGRLMRRAGYGFTSTVPTSCPTSASSGAQVVLENVSSCTLSYVLDDATTSQVGYAAIDLSLTRGNEVARISSGAYVANQP